MNENHAVKLLEEEVGHNKQLLHKVLSSLTLSTPPNNNPRLLLQRSRPTSGMDEVAEDSSAQDGSMNLHGKGIQLLGEVAYINDGLRQVLSSLITSSRSNQRPMVLMRGTSSSSSYSANAKRAMTATRKAAAAAFSFELINENDAKSKAEEDVTIYFCLSSANGAEEYNWFSIQTWHVSPLSTDRYICPIFKGPVRPVHYSPTLPIAVGPYIFFITAVGNRGYREEIPSQSVFYRDTRNKGKEEEDGGWMEAPPPPPGLHGDTNGYYFFHANDKIYGLELFGRSYSSWGHPSIRDLRDLSFHLKCLDCHDLNGGWQSIYPPINDGGTELSDDDDQHPKTNHTGVEAFKLEYATTMDSSTGKTNKRHARRALILTTRGCWVSYDFETNEFSVSEEVQYNFGPWFESNVVSLGDVFYKLMSNERDVTVPLMAYIHHPFSAQKGHETRVLGLDNVENALPVGYKRRVYSYLEVVYPPSKLLVIGEGRLCILWTDIRSPVVTLIHCTIFDVCLEADGNPHAVNVTTRMYKVRGSHRHDLHVVASSRKMISQFMKREFTVQGGGGWFEGSTSKIGDGDEGRWREGNQEDEEEEKKKNKKRKKKKNRRG